MEDLKYHQVGDKYSITYISEYNPEIIDLIFNAIVPYYGRGKLKYSNVCGENAEFICKNLKIEGIKVGKIIIADWIPNVENNLNSIPKKYGSIGATIGSSYHALVYLELNIGDNLIHVAIETTICTPCKLQFYVGTIEEFTHIIKTRYLCTNFNVSYDCDKSWHDIAYSGVDIAYGLGNKRKTKIKKRRRTTKKQKRRRTTKKRKNMHKSY